MDTIAGPKDCKVGAEPSSCQLTVAWWPPTNVVEATGEVTYLKERKKKHVSETLPPLKKTDAYRLRTKTLAKAEAERVRATKMEENMAKIFIYWGC